MSKAKRLLDILMFVTTKRKFTAQELADEFNISVRTIHRYLLDLSDMGLSIYAEQGRNGGYTVLTDRILPPVLFTEEEAVSIFFAFQSFHYYRNLPFDTEISSVAHKLYHSLSSDSKVKVDKMRSFITFWNPKRSIEAPYLTDMLEASIANKNVHIQYESKSGTTTKYIHPIGVYAHNGLWYFPAYDYNKQKILLFRIDRILSILSTDENEADFMNLEEWFISNQVKNPIRLHVLLSREGVRQCKSAPELEGYVTTQEDGTGYIDSLIEESEISYIAPLFYRLGGHAQIKEPRDLIDKLRLQAREILRIYAGEE